jgi:hypothetical protein
MKFKIIILLFTVMLVGNLNAMQEIKPYDPEGLFKKVIRNGIGIAAVVGGSCYAYKKFQQGNLVGR